MMTLIPTKAIARGSLLILICVICGCGPATQHKADDPKPAAESRIPFRFVWDGSVSAPKGWEELTPTADGTSADPYKGNLPYKGFMTVSDWKVGTTALLTLVDPIAGDKIRVVELAEMNAVEFSEWVDLRARYKREDGIDEVLTFGDRRGRLISTSSASPGDLTWLEFIGKRALQIEFESDLPTADHRARAVGFIQSIKVNP